jgi:hypothetical protein
MNVLCEGRRLLLQRKVGVGKGGDRLLHSKRVQDPV